KNLLKKQQQFKSQIPAHKKEDLLIIEKLPGYFLLGALLVSLYFLFGILKPFLSVIFISGVLAVAFYPIYKRILRAVNGRERLSSFFTCLLVVIIIILPLLLFSFLLTNEAIDTYKIISVKIESGVFDKYFEWKNGGFFYDMKQQIDSYLGPYISPIFNVEDFDVKQKILDASQGISSFLLKQTTNVVASIWSFLFNFILLLFSLYYFFKDGDKLIEKLGHLSPLPYVYEGELFRKMDSMIKAIIFGVFLTAVVQGLVGGIGFAIAGVSNPIFWGTAIALASLVPVVGTGMVWMPAALVLVIFGNYWAALFLAIWGFLVIGTVDNFLRPYLIGGKAKTHPLLTFFVILGGVFTMGLKGIIVGPVVLMFMLSLLHIYEAEYTKVLKK
ncbi:MAG: AI-2E family transporter, partial [Candidatus Gracilibacteria bacterium]